MFEEPNVPSRFWTEGTNHRAFFNWLGKQLGYKELDDWYNVTTEIILKHGGLSLLREYYNNSLSQALQTLYPEHNWLPWRFWQAPKGCWENKRNQKQFFDWLGEQLSYKQLVNETVQVT